MIQEWHCGMIRGVHHIMIQEWHCGMIRGVHHIMMQEWHCGMMIQEQNMGWYKNHTWIDTRSASYNDIRIASWNDTRNEHGMIQEADQKNVLIQFKLIVNLTRSSLKSDSVNLFSLAMPCLQGQANNIDPCLMSASVVGVMCAAVQTKKVRSGQIRLKCT